MALAILADHLGNKRSDFYGRYEEGGIIKTHPTFPLKGWSGEGS